ncbi:galactose-specific lectin nattectin-like, partial [Plectropomus leopardus]|uniref:galactose-specific lectin nattectin-like n=1 Tax=Plectropomus leopardus TaxID=160734 RepID=UPI001C4C9204
NSQQISIQVHSPCPSHWSEINGRCFHYFPAALSWAKAEKYCQSVGGNLASVHNIEEYHAIQRLILKTSHEDTSAWIGGSDAEEEHVWLWSDGSSFTYTNWHPGQPDNNFFRQHCIRINFGGPKAWDDLLCTDHLPFVCAKKMWQSHA